MTANANVANNNFQTTTIYDVVIPVTLYYHFQLKMLRSVCNDGSPKYWWLTNFWWGLLTGCIWGKS